MLMGLKKLRGLDHVGTGALARPCRATLGSPLLAVPQYHQPYDATKDSSMSLRISLVKRCGYTSTKKAANAGRSLSSLGNTAVFTPSTSQIRPAQLWGDPTKREFNDPVLARHRNHSQSWPGSNALSELPVIGYHRPLRACLRSRRTRKSIRG